MKEHVWIPSRGKNLSAMLNTPGEVQPEAPIVVCCHGFTGDKLGPSQITLHLANALEQTGASALRFDFLGSGESEGEFQTDTSVAGWKEDLKNVLVWVKLQPQFAAAPIILFGHSLGGLIVLTHEASDQSVIGRIAFAPVTDPIANFREILLGPELWAKSLAGETVANFFAKGFRLDRQFVEDLMGKNYDPIGATANLTTPLLIIHGLEDAVVPVQGSVKLHEKYGGAKLFHQPAMDHLATGYREEFVQWVLDWMRDRQGN